MPPAVVALDFDPILRLGGLAIRLDTLVAAIGLLLALLVAALIARQTPAPGEPEIGGRTLRVDDILFLALAALPGAVVGGRIGYALLHPDYYAANPAALADPGQGSLELGLAVVGGSLTGGYAAHVLSGSASRWFHVAAIPVLLALGVAKLAMASAGSGQGSPWGGEWATRYVGPGPWGSLAPDVAAYPSQLLEAGAIAVVALVLVALAAAGSFDRRDGLAFLTAIGGWAAVRVAIGATWRDPAVLGPLRMGQVIALLVVVGCIVAAVAVVRLRGVRAAGAAEPRWPDPETRPHF